MFDILLQGLIKIPVVKCQAQTNKELEIILVQRHNHLRECTPSKPHIINVGGTFPLQYETMHYYYTYLNLSHLASLSFGETVKQ
jgi:hypothetical protein